MVLNPSDKIISKLDSKIPSNLISYLPKKWEKNGDVLIIVLPVLLKDYKKIIGEVYADVSNCKSVLNDFGGISGELRKPNVELIYGDENTETIHKENGVSFKLDPKKVMFSSGNIDERKRMSIISNPIETVVDLFAGIGYFSIPMAVYSKPKKIISCEINPVAFDFLKKNISENKVDAIIEPILGDSNHVAPQGIADRIIMGYFHETASFLETAIKSLKNQKGIIHYHDTFPEKVIPFQPLKLFQETCRTFNRIVNIESFHKIKSYAPGISHYVFDIEIKEREEQ